MRLDEIAQLTGIDPGRLQRILRNLVKRGFVATVGEDFLVTGDGIDVVSTWKSYGIQTDILVDNVLKIKSWLEKNVPANRGKEFTLGLFGMVFPELSVTNKRIGRILVSLGCRRIKRGGTIRYVFPEKVIQRELRDLTRTKREHLHEGSVNRAGG